MYSATHGRVKTPKHVALGMSVRHITGNNGEIIPRVFTYQPGGGGGTPYNGLYREALPERGTFFRLQVYKRVGISQV